MSNLNEEIKYSYATCGNVVPEEVEEENIEEEAEAEAAGEEDAVAEDAEGTEEADVADEEAAPEEAEEAAADDEVPFPDELGVCECLMTHDQDTFYPTDGDAHILFTYEGVDYMYPPNYGLAVCADWDADLDPFCAENGPEFCGAEWCFVSPDCEASDTTTANLNAEIAYSYATCGFSADFPDEGEEAAAADEPEDDEGEDNEEEQSGEEDVEPTEESVVPEATGEDETGICECVDTHG